MVEKQINPYQGLKLFVIDAVTGSEIVEKQINPYQGLKPNSKARIAQQWRKLKNKLIPIRD